MPRRVNGPQNREQLQMMVEAVRGEVNLAQDLLNSYEQDLASLEATTNTKAFVEFDKKKMSGTYVRRPDRSELNPEINEALIVEFYNR